MKENAYKVRYVRGILLLLILTLFAITPVKVNAAPRLNKKSITLVKGKSYVLKIRGTKKKVKWKTNKKSIIKLSRKKKTSVKITASKVGKATVTAKLGKKSYRCIVKVVAAQLNRNSLTMKIGNVKKLRVTGGEKNIRWKSSNQSVAVVGADGKVVALRSGSTKITARMRGLVLACKVKVRINVSTTGKTKRVWVVTRKAYTEQEPVYETVGYIKCLTCGREFSKDEVDAYGRHASEHMRNGQEARYTVLSRRVKVGEKTVRHKEEGYHIKIRT